MIAFAKRRLIGLGAFSLISLGLIAAYSVAQAQLMRTSLFSGFALLFLVIFLIGLNWRKRFSFLPVGRASTWLQVHIYAGWVSVIVFFIHTGFRQPNGPMELIVAFLFLIVAISGMAGLVMSRVIPKRLTAHGGNITYEEVPKMQRLLKIKAESIALKSIEETKKSTIADFYVERIEVFLMGSRRFFWNHLFGSEKHLTPLLTRMSAMHRYLNEQEIQVMNQLEELVLERDRLDYQQCLLSILKCWLFVHIPLSYSLLVFGVMHGALAYRFVGG